MYTPVNFRPFCMFGITDVAPKADDSHQSDFAVLLGKIASTYSQSQNYRDFLCE